MFTLDLFTSEWQRLHHPSMDVSSDVAFYYQVYDKLHRLAEDKPQRIGEQAIFSLLLYTENIIAIGLDGVYEYRYRSVGNVVFRWCDAWGMDAGVTSRVHNLVSDAVADAPRSALRQWITESVLSCDFQRLSDMLTWFARKDPILRLVYPDLRFRKAMFLRLAGDKQTARQMLWTDMAFHWRDKYGDSLPDTLAKQFRLSASSQGEQDKALWRETAERLGSVRSERLDTYTVIERKDKCTLTLRHRDGRVFRNVTFPVPLSEDIPEQSLAAQLVTYSGKTWLNGSARWLDRERQADWNGGNLWNDILAKEQEAARHVSFSTLFGKRISLYEDLYTVPEDPEEAHDADMGIYPDEPNIVDFLAWLNPSDAVSGMAK